MCLVAGGGGELVAGQQLVEDADEGLYVVLGLSWAFIGEWVGRLLGIGCLGGGAGLFAEFGDAQVEQADDGMVVDQQEFGAEMTVDDVAIVQIGHSIGRLLEPVDGDEHIGGAILAQPLRQISPLGEFKHNIETIRFLGDVEGLDEVRVIEGGGGLGAVEKFADGAGAFGQLAAEKCHGRASCQLVMFRQVNTSQEIATEFVQELVFTES